MTKHIVTADDVERLAETGERELMLREHTVLTDAAADAAAQLGIRLVEGSTYSTRDHEAEPPPRSGAGGLPAPAIGGLVRSAAEHPDVNKIAFTGSTVTGHSVMRAGRPREDRHRAVRVVRNLIA